MKPSQLDRLRWVNYWSCWIHQRDPQSDISRAWRSIVLDAHLSGPEGIMGISPSNLFSQGFLT